MLDDDGLITRVVKFNDHLAFTHLVKRYQSRLRYSILQINGWNETLADDIMQETFISCYKSLSKFRRDSQLLTWLYRIAYNHLQQFYRSHAKESDNHLDFDESHEIIDAEQQTAINPMLSIDDEVSHSQLHRKVATILLKLPVQPRMVLHLHLHREYNSNEIAKMLDMPVGTVKSHINRGKHFLRQHLTELSL